MKEEYPNRSFAAKSATQPANQARDTFSAEEHRLEALQLLEKAENSPSAEWAAILVAKAQVHATLALSARSGASQHYGSGF